MKQVSPSAPTCLLSCQLRRLRASLQCHLATRYAQMASPAWPTAIVARPVWDQIPVLLSHLVFPKGEVEGTTGGRAPCVTSALRCLKKCHPDV